MFFCFVLVASYVFLLSFTLKASHRRLLLPSLFYRHSSLCIVDVISYNKDIWTREHRFICKQWCVSFKYKYIRLRTWFWCSIGLSLGKGEKKNKAEQGCSQGHWSHACWLLSWRWLAGVVLLLSRDVIVVGGHCFIFCDSGRRNHKTGQSWVLVLPEDMAWLLVLPSLMLSLVLLVPAMARVEKKSWDLTVSVLQLPSQLHHHLLPQLLSPHHHPLVYWAVERHSSKAEKVVDHCFLFLVLLLRSTPNCLLVLLLWLLIRIQQEESGLNVWLVRQWVSQLQYVPCVLRDELRSLFVERATFFIWLQLFVQGGNISG